MKSHITSLLLLTGSLLSFAQTPSLIHTAEGLEACESAVYDKEQNIIYASVIGGKETGDGSIATVSLDGKIINHDFVDGLEDPKGIAITKDRLYVSDVTVLVEADLKTGKVIKRHTAKGATFLNDVTIADNGNIYVSDTRNSEIYLLDKKGNFSLWLKNDALDHPNGLLAIDNTMYVASWGASEEGGGISTVNLETKEIVSISKKIGNLDGIRPYDKNHLIISDWRSGKIHLFNPTNGNTKEILKVDYSVGDIAYLQDKKTLLLPMNKQKKLMIYTVFTFF